MGERTREQTAIREVRTRRLIALGAPVMLLVTYLVDRWTNDATLAVVLGVVCYLLVIVVGLRIWSSESSR